MGRLKALLMAIVGCCRRLGGCISSQPVLFCAVSVVVSLLLALILVLNICLVKLFTLPGAIIANATLLWLLLRLIVRVIVFPGSILLWKRNTEVTYRVEMAKKFHLHIGQFRDLLYHVVKAPAGDPASTVEGALLGVMVIEGLSRNFRVQQRDQVKFTAEQAKVKVLVQRIEEWAKEAKVSEGRGAGKTLPEWMRGMSQSIVPVPLSYAMEKLKLPEQTESSAIGCLECVEQLLGILSELQVSLEGCCANSFRFLREPTVGSLHQLRAELQMRYDGTHYWLRTASGRKLDAMLISCNPVAADVATSSPAGKEVDPGFVIVWCNANAAYYETMAYESHWLDFYISQGCSVFLFNYSGFGRSQGRPSPKSFASDGRAAVDFLRRRGFTQIGVHGRSIGGIAACNLASSFPDVVKLLIADRTFSSLASAARCTFGAWAVHALSLSATWADNLSGYYQARCYKVAMCDAKDATIPDMAALRTAVAQEALQGLPPSERLNIAEDTMARLVEAWCFFDVLLGICDRETGDCQQCPGCRAPEPRRPARQPVVGKPQPEDDLLIATETFDGDDDRQRLVAPKGKNGTGPKGVIDVWWLEQHVSEVRSAMGSLIDPIRLAIDAVGAQLNANGLTLEEAMRVPREEAPGAVHSFLANLQVWGSVGSLREPPRTAADRDIEIFLIRGLIRHEDDTPDLHTRMQRVAASLTPDRLAQYHQRLSRTRIGQARRELRKHTAALRRSLEALGLGEELVARQVCSAALLHLREIEAFATTIYRFFKCIDLASVSVPSMPESVGDADPPPPSPDASSVDASGHGSDDSEEGRGQRSTSAIGASGPRCSLDRSTIGYVLSLNCGHNGSLSEGEAEHLKLHLRAAKFGKYA